MNLEIRPIADHELDAVIDQIRGEVLELLLAQLYFLDPTDDLVVGQAWPPGRRAPRHVPQTVGPPVVRGEPVAPLRARLSTHVSSATQSEIACPTHRVFGRNHVQNFLYQ